MSLDGLIAGPGGHIQWLTKHPAEPKRPLDAAGERTLWFEVLRG
jgi:hypothetical protein